MYFSQLHFGPDDWEKVRDDGTRKLKLDAIPSLNLHSVINVMRTPMGNITNSNVFNNNASPPMANIININNYAAPSVPATSNDSPLPPTGPSQILHDHCYTSSESSSFACSTPKVSRQDFNTSKPCRTISKIVDCDGSILQPSIDSNTSILKISLDSPINSPEDYSCTALTSMDALSIQSMEALGLVFLLWRKKTRC